MEMRYLVWKKKKNELAQLALRSNRVAVWRHEVPVCIEQIIAQDCTDPE